MILVPLFDFEGPDRSLLQMLQELQKRGTRGLARCLATLLCRESRFAAVSPDLPA
jgi:hypothetical protein